MVRSLRDSDDLPVTIGLAASLALGATRTVLHFFRPEENKAFGRGYIEEIREPLKQVSGWDLPLPTLRPCGPSSASARAGKLQ